MLEMSTYKLITLIDGTFVDEAHRSARTISLARAIGRARRQQCEVAGEWPTDTFDAIRDELAIADQLASGGL